MVALNQDWLDTFTCMVGCNMLVAVTVIMLKRAIQVGGLFTAIYVLLGVWNLAYLLTQFLNPGLVLNEPQKHGTMVERCSDCYAELHPGQRHCDICRICVYGHSHHCGWLGRCIGLYNCIPYYVFIISSIALMFCLAATAVIGVI